MKGEHDQMGFDVRVLDEYIPPETSLAGLIARFFEKNGFFGLEDMDRLLAKMVVFGYYGKEGGICNIDTVCHQYLECFYLIEGHSISHGLVGSFLSKREAFMLKLIPEFGQWSNRVCDPEHICSYVRSLSRSDNTGPENDKTHSQQQ